MVHNGTVVADVWLQCGLQWYCSSCLVTAWYCSGCCLATTPHRCGYKDAIVVATMVHCCVNSGQWHVWSTSVAVSGT